MTPDTANYLTQTPAITPPSTAGITTKVVKGSLWTLAGQLLPMAATIVTTPFVIRALGSESYGILVLIGLVSNYFSFGDFGMGVASTKFASEDFGRARPADEGAVVRTAALISLASTAMIALPIILFAASILSYLNVPAELATEAALALRLSAITFIVSMLCGVLNSPQLARLRMDLNASIGAIGRVVLSFGTVGVLWAGGGIAGAAAFGLGVSFVVLLMHMAVSSRLLPELMGTTLDHSKVRPLLSFGVGMVASGIAGMLLINSEKVLLTGLVSVRSLAYYSVAFTFANMATLFSWGMVQSLIPAYSQLLVSERRDQLDFLFARSVRINVAWLLPGIMVLFVIAKPLLTVWAGEEFGRESVLPFYILLAGLFFNIVAHSSHALLTASGRTDALAKLYWIELVPYLAAAVILIYYFGIIGAALAWSLRVAGDAFAVTFLAKRIVGLRFSFRASLDKLYLSAIVLVFPVVLTAFFPERVWLSFLLAAITGSIYLFLIWRFALEEAEESWVKRKWQQFTTGLRIR